MNEQIRLSEEVKEAAAAIGAFYLQKNNGDYIATEKEITAMRISKIEVIKKAIHITVARPGLLIGKRGTNIDALETFLDTKIHIIEELDPLYNYLIPDDYQEY